MEANTGTLVLVGAIILSLLVLILIKNYRDKRDFYNSMNASDDLSKDPEHATAEE